MMAPSARSASPSSSITSRWQVGSAARSADAGSAFAGGGSSARALTLASPTRTRAPRCSPTSTTSRGQPRTASCGIAAFRIAVALPDTASRLELNGRPGHHDRASAPGRQSLATAPRSAPSAAADAPRAASAPTRPGRRRRPPASDRQQEIARPRLRRDRGPARAYEREQVKAPARPIRRCEDERSEALRLRSEVGRAHAPSSDLPRRRSCDRGSSAHARPTSTQPGASAAADRQERLRAGARTSALKQRDRGARRARRLLEVRSKPPCGCATPLAPRRDEALAERRAALERPRRGRGEELDSAPCERAERGAQPRATRRARRRSRIAADRAARHSNTTPATRIRAAERRTSPPANATRAVATPDRPDRAAAEPITADDGGRARGAPRWR